MANTDKPKSEVVESGATGEPAETSSHSQIDDFLKTASRLTPLRAAGERGRLIFALDATMSRRPTWDSACRHQAEMFHQTAAIGGLDVQLVYFRGFRECRASKWVDDPKRLADLMTRIDCRGGHTQIGKVLTHAHKEAAKHRVHALVYVGDCMEEDVDHLCAEAGKLGLLHVPAFMFQEGYEPLAERTFREIARLTGGAWCRFDAAAANQLRELLSAVAVYAAGGRKALENLGAKSGHGRLLLEQLR